MIIFDGESLAAEREIALYKQVSQLNQPLKIAAILFSEDKGSQLYTRLKAEAAARVGIEYEVFSFSLTAGVDEIVAQLQKLNTDPSVTGIIIQKPWRQTWAIVKGVTADRGQKALRQAFNSWWRYLANQIVQAKDVDGLHPQTLASIENNTWQEEGRVLPATARAILTILNQAWEKLGTSDQEKKQQQILILGRSDIVGLPVFYELKNQGFKVQLLTRDDLDQRLKFGKKLLDGDVVISATGSHHLLNGEMLKEGVIAIDAGEPRPDMDQASVRVKASFQTPVPGGVGPMTVVSLLENCLHLQTD